MYNDYELNLTTRIIIVQNKTEYMNQEQINLMKLKWSVKALFTFHCLD